MQIKFYCNSPFKWRIGKAYLYEDSSTVNSLFAAFVHTGTIKTNTEQNNIKITYCMFKSFTSPFLTPKEHLFLTCLSLHQRSTWFYLVFPNTKGALVFNLSFLTQKEYLFLPYHSLHQRSTCSYLDFPCTKGVLIFTLSFLTPSTCSYLDFPCTKGALVFNLSFLKAKIISSYLVFPYSKGALVHTLSPYSKGALLLTLSFLREEEHSFLPCISTKGWLVHTLYFLSPKEHCSYLYFPCTKEAHLLTLSFLTQQKHFFLPCLGKFVISECSWHASINLTVKPRYV